MPSGRAGLRVLLRSLALVVLASGCRREDTRPSREDTKKAIAELEKQVARVQEAEARKAARAAAPAARSSEAPGEEPPEAPGAPPSGGQGANIPRASDAAWLTDEPVELGPQGPATASPAGVVLNDKEGALVVARLEPASRTQAAGKTRIHAIPEGTGPFGLGRGPSLGDGFAYWISHGSLVRRRLGARGAFGPLEILARDAFDGTRVAVPLHPPGARFAKIPEVAAYIVRPPKDDAPLVAKLWTEGAPAELLTAEGNSTHSVSLVRTDDGVLAISVQARMAMTPVHARSIRFPGGRPLFGDDLVVWVGGGIQPLTEMTVLPVTSKTSPQPSGLAGFLPHERSMTEFGVACLDIGLNPGMDTKTSWMLYPNGIDPAPVAAVHLCGEPVIVYAAPETAAPDARQELLIRALDASAGVRSAHVASATSFYFVSASNLDAGSTKSGALVTWVTDQGTFASTVRCTRGAK